MQSIGFLGGDVSKGRCDFVLFDYQGSTLEDTFQLDDNRSGHSALYEVIKKAKQQFKIKKIIVGLESTGGYENNWYIGLREKSKSLKLEVFRVNPKRIFHEAKTEGRRSIDDGVSAKVIAGYLRKNYGQNDLSPQRLDYHNDHITGMLKLYKYIQQLIRERVRSKNTIEKLLYSSMPELLALKGEKYANWFLEVLIKYPSKESIQKAGIQKLTKIKYLNETKAIELIEAVKQSVSKTMDPIEAMVIKERARDIKQLNAKINKLNKSLVNIAQESLSKQIDLLCSIKGIAADTAVPLLLEIGELSRFENAKNLVAYWGINPTVKKSGDRNYRIGMSKDGSTIARAVLYVAAKNVIQFEPYFKALYHKYRTKGKSHSSTLGIIMAKLTRVIFGMLRNDAEFDAGIDTFNQNKKESLVAQMEVNQSILDKPKRRYQKNFKQAPVSKREERKRKKEQLCPNMESP